MQTTSLTEARDPAADLRHDAQAPAPLPCTFAQKGSAEGWFFYDEAAERFVRLPFSDRDGELDSVLSYEELPGLGWTYRTEEDGRQGFISRDFRQVVSPRFDRIEADRETALIFSLDSPEITDTEDFISGAVAWGFSADAPGAQEADPDDPWSEARLGLDLWYYRHNDSRCARGLTRLADTLREAAERCAAHRRRNAAPDDDTVWTAEDFLDWSNWPTIPLSAAGKGVSSLSFRLEYDYDAISDGAGGDRDSFRCLLTRRETGYGDDIPINAEYRFVYERADRLEFYSPDFRDGVSHFNGRAFPLKTIDLFECVLHADSETSYGKLRHLAYGWYAEQRDGWWGLFEGFDDRWFGHPEPVLPYAFTDIRFLHGIYLTVERFGRKGVYDFDARRFAIPVAFDSVEYETFDEKLQEDVFRIGNLGFVGRVTEQLRWLEPLHRPEEEYQADDSDPFAALFGEPDLDP